MDKGLNFRTLERKNAEASGKKRLERLWTGKEGKRKKRKIKKERDREHLIGLNPKGSRSDKWK